MTGWRCTYHPERGASCEEGEHSCDAPAHGLVWRHIDGRDEAERAWLEKESGLAHGVIVALTAVETRPRTDLIGNGAIVNLRGTSATAGDAADDLVSIRLYAEKNRVISVGYRPLCGVEEVRAKMAAGSIKDPGDLITAFAVSVTHELDPKIVEFGDEVDACETSFDPDKAFSMRRTIARVRSQAIDFRRFVAPQRQALERLAGLEVDWLEEDDRIHLREAADRFARMAEELEVVRERSALLHEQLTDLRAEQIEQRGLLLAIVALIFLPLTFVTGLFGMNFDHIPFQHSRYGFEWTVAASLAIAGAITFYFYKARWFRR